MISLLKSKYSVTKSTQCNFQLRNVVALKSVKSQTEKCKGLMCLQRLKPYEQLEAVCTVSSGVLGKTGELNVNELTPTSSVKPLQVDNVLNVLQESKELGGIDLPISLMKDAQNEVICSKTSEIAEKTRNCEISPYQSHEKLSCSLHALGAKTFPLKLSVEFKQIVAKFSALDLTEKVSTNNQLILEVTKRGSYEEKYNAEPLKYVLNCSGTLRLVVLFKGVVKEVEIFKDAVLLEDVVVSLLKDLSDPDKRFCSGLASDAIEIISQLPLIPKTLKIIDFPVKHFMSLKCPVIFTKPNNIVAADSNVCKECKYLMRYLRASLKRRIKANASPTSRKRKCQPSSTCPTSFLSPGSLALKKKLASQRYHIAKQKIVKLNKKLTKFKMILSDKQHQEMKSVTAKIQENFPSVLEEVLAIDTNESSESAIAKRKRLREVWDEDCAANLAQEKEDFMNDQKKNVTGKRGNRWSAITYRLALAVACRSHAAYDALSSFKVLNLPSWRSLQRKTKKNLDEPGVNHEKLREEKETYNLFKHDQIANGLAEPKGDGVLIFDEVKVAGKIMWNSKNHKLYGAAMPYEEYAYLDDLYEEVCDDKDITKANYMLQFLWRDLTANYDVIGPYFSLPSTADAHVTMSCLLQVIKAFEYQHFHISAIVCDGASANLSVIKMMVGLDVTFPYQKKNGEINFNIPTSFPNPLRMERNIHFVICPSHELKNLINQLFASDPERAKEFDYFGITFGWKHIVDLKKRDDALRDCGIPRKIPKLYQSYVDRDAWTKLNVKPARILQQNDVLSAIYEYAHPPPTDGLPQPQPEDYESVMGTYHYLKACHNLFEMGTLKKGAIDDLNCDIIRNIDAGMQYFSNWFKYILENDSTFNLSNPRQKKFISWQTWALLRIMVYGFKGLAEEFLRENPGYYLCPIRVNGSAVETLFSQYKHGAGGKLTGINFATVRKTSRTIRDMKGHHSGAGYRNEKLYVMKSFTKKYFNAA